MYLWRCDSNVKFLRFTSLHFLLSCDWLPVGLCRRLSLLVFRQQSHEALQRQSEWTSHSWFICADARSKCDLTWTPERILLQRPKPVLRKIWMRSLMTTNYRLCCHDSSTNSVHQHWNSCQCPCPEWLEPHPDGKPRSRTRLLWNLLLHSLWPLLLLNLHSLLQSWMVKIWVRSHQRTRLCCGSCKTSLISKPVRWEKKNLTNNNKKLPDHWPFAFNE